MTGAERDELQEQFQQLMLERLKRISDAIDRAEAGLADKEDWDLIRWECGLPRLVQVTIN